MGPGRNDCGTQAKLLCEVGKMNRNVGYANEHVGETIMGRRQNDYATLAKRPMT